MNEVRLSLLLEKYRNGTLAAEERSELERELLSSADARKLFWEQARFHALLARWGQEEWGRRMAAAPKLVAAKPSPLWWWRGVKWGALAAAAAVFLLAAVIFHDRLSSPAPGVAVLASAVGVEWSDASHAPVQGAVLTPGWLRLKSGAALVEFYSGARVIVEGPAELQLVSATEAFCRVGRVSAQVPTPAHGFKMGAPGMMVTDLGTEFGLSVEQGAAPEVHVFTGKVELRRPNITPEPVVLPAGRAVRVEASTLVDIPADRAAFLSEFEMIRRALAHSNRRQEAWERATSVLSRDPAALIHYTFVNKEPWARTLANQATSENAGTPGDIVGCQWTEGRWQGKTALQFKGSGDRVRLAVPGRFQAVTLLSWVRIDAPQSDYHPLLSPDDLVPGTLRWELTSDGRLRFGIMRKPGNPEPSWEVVMSSPLLTPERIGKWLMVATVFDGKMVRHYLNGNPVSFGAANSPVPLVIGTAELGNRRDLPTRNPQMCMDEFVILSRAMTGEELRSLYELGAPENAVLQAGE